MRVQKIHLISLAGRDAEVHLSDGKRVCVAFCQPCEYGEGEVLDGPLHAFMTKAVMLSYGDDISMQRANQNSFAYKCIGRVVDAQTDLVAIGNFEIELDDRIPAGVSAGDLVDFECARIDLW